MILSGSLRLSVPPDLAAEWFQDPDSLGTFLPGNSELKQTGPGAFDFVVRKEAGVVTLKLPGSLTVTPEQSGYRFNADARHIMGGSATLSLLVSFVELDDGCWLSYSGTLDATGLAGRLLRDRADQAQDMIDARFTAVKVKLERRYRGRSA